jgi:hypothetical protein
MIYDSPATIRRRQESQAAPKRTRKAAPIKVMTDEQWSSKCDFHIEAILNPISSDNAGAHARALVHMAIERRANEIQRDYRRAYWKAVITARHELLNVEVAS